ncbi:hypothetical protein HY224_02500 [Candidatus Uhrbacteria bacterium]|nr:hypothetical protein [Candidatus Uhrbacteria bacterium]
MEWDEVLRKELIGRQLLIFESGECFCGHISKIEKLDDGKKVRFHMEWTAVQIGDRWRRWRTTDVSVLTGISTPELQENGDILFTAPPLFTATIVARNCRVIQLQDVEGGHSQVSPL